MLRISGRSAGQPQSNHWQKIIENLNILLKVLQDNHVCISFFDYLFICDSLQLDVCLTVVLFVLRYPQSWLRKFSPRYSHTLMYSYSIGELSSEVLIFVCEEACVVHDYCSFCSLLLRRECCSFSNGEYVKAGLAELELWCAKATAEVICLLCDSLVSFRI